jgi:hypothetical protein
MKARMTAALSILMFVILIFSRVEANALLGDTFLCHGLQFGTHSRCGRGITMVWLAPATSLARRSDGHSRPVAVACAGSINGVAAKADWLLLR